METIILASASPRRRDILASLGLPSLISPAELDESLRDELPPHERALALAEDKARAVAAGAGTGAPRLVLGADTLVCTAERGSETVLGKPRDRAEARSMIALLSGRDHVVHTGLILLDRLSGRAGRSRSDSIVRFAPMDEAEIEAYLDTGEWEGVAGGYRIQGAAALYIERIEGSWSGIVGLPIRELYVMLRAANYRIRPTALP